jgi:NADPH:quinone reductase-like Zn-dependent oxidoreductase
VREVVVTRFGKPEVMQVRERTASEPAEGEVRVSVEAVGINFAEILARMGLYPDAGKPPFVPGYEFAGRVEATGAGVEGIGQGDRVTSSCPGRREWMR